MQRHGLQAIRPQLYSPGAGSNAAAAAASSAPAEQPGPTDADGTPADDADRERSGSLLSQRHAYLNPPPE